MEVKKFILAIIAIVAIGAIGFVKQGSAQAASCSLDIVNGPGNHGIKVNGNTASATVVIKGTSGRKKSFTLAAWKLPNQQGTPLTAQKFYGYSTMTKGPGTHTISTGIPDCYWQVDLLGGTRPKSINGDANYQWPQDQLANYRLGGNKSCTPPPPADVCPNIPGNQATIPDGMVKDDNGNCVTEQVDVCPNIDGMQTEVPDGMVKDDNGNCVTEQVDVCPNIDGMQTEVPDGMVKNAAGNCVTEETDVCPNIDGMQNTVPDNMVIDENGNCVVPEDGDVCPNIDGMQTEVPDGMVKDENGQCVLKPAVVVVSKNGPSTPQKLADTGPGLFAGIASSITGIGSGAAHFIIRRKKLLV